jgi:DEAD/DEAH box helicase domain-containing protein
MRPLIPTQRQQIGRAGRRSRDSLAVFVPEAMPVDNHYLMNPEELSRGPVADIILDLENPLILEVRAQDHVDRRL